MACNHHRHHQTLSLLTAYVVFGVLHELAHLATASWLLQPSSGGPTAVDDSAAGMTVVDLLGAAIRAVIGRYSLVQVSASGNNDKEAEEARMVILHAGWMFSLALAIVCHLLYIINRNKRNVRVESSMNIFIRPTLPIAAYVTAMEAIVTDLLGFTPIHPYLPDSSRLICFCGNFGVLLLNPSWLSIDGGRTALDVLEKMVNVTMMRGMFPSALSFISLQKNEISQCSMEIIKSQSCTTFVFILKCRCSIWWSSYIRT